MLLVKKPLPDRKQTDYFTVNLCRAQSSSL
jgi:hypothetical protein